MTNLVEPLADLSRVSIERYMKSIDYGFVCETCGLSDHGAERFRRNGFKVYSCSQCKDHFNDKE